MPKHLLLQSEMEEHVSQKTGEIEVHDHIQD